MGAVRQISDRLQFPISNFNDHENDDEDEQTLAAIDEGIRDAEAGRTVSGEEARKLLPQWIIASSTHKER